MTSFLIPKKKRSIEESELNINKNSIKENSNIEIKNSEKNKNSLLMKRNSISSVVKSSSNETFRINSLNIKSLFCEKLEKTIKVFSLMDNNISKTKEDIKLIVSDYEDSNFFQGKKIIISNFGIENGLRLLKDGFVFFGTCKEYKGVIINDIIINSDNLNIKRLFVIFYKDSNYYLKANLDKEDIEKDNIYTYIKISKINFPISKRRKNFFQIGNCVLKTEIKENDNSIKIEVNTYKWRKTYIFSPFEIKAITIGRNENNTIYINEKLVSNYQCTIFFDSNEKLWFIVDGFMNKNSTNGTWKFCNEKVQLMNVNDYIKIGKSIIQISKFNSLDK